MSRIDYVVNSTLYNYGLEFSYGWANTYWVAYNTVFVIFSAMAGFIYWFGSEKTTCDKKVASALIVTINLLALGNLQDVMYFIFWAGGLPPSNVAWWWTWWNGIFGTWNTDLQVSLTTMALGVSLLIWAFALHQKKETCPYPL